MEHPKSVLYLEHDGKVLLVNSDGNGPQIPVMNNTGDTEYRFPTEDEVKNMGIEWDVKNKFDIIGFQVTKAHPNVEWPKHWAWKDECISDDSVHPIARESIYRSIHRLVSKVMVLNSNNQVLMGKIERGHFVGHWTLPGGYMDHDEHPAVACVRETLEEMGIDIELDTEAPIITQRIFTNEGISFVSFTYLVKINSENLEFKLKKDEIEEIKWFNKTEAIKSASSWFDSEAIKNLI